MLIERSKCDGCGEWFKSTDLTPVVQGTFSPTERLCSECLRDACQADTPIN